MDAREHLDDDIVQLRAFRAHDAVPPVGLLERLRDDLQLTIDAETHEARHAHRARAAASPWQRFLQHRLARPSLVASAAACLALSVAGIGAIGNHDRVGASGATSATQASASLFDGTAQRLFGGMNANAAPAVGVLDARDDARDVEHAITDRKRSDEQHALLVHLTRDPARLLDTLRMSARQDDAADPSADVDQVAFILAMNLVADRTLPGDLRASVLRAVGGLDGVEAAAYVTDDLGRAGILISHFDVSSGVRDQYVLDQSTGTLREQRSFVAAYVDPACKPGTFTSFALFDDDGHSIEPANIPTLAWPEVVPICSPASRV